MQTGVFDVRNQFNCPICDDEYGPGLRHPVMCSICGYSLCSDCATKTSRTTNPDGSSAARCPSCRTAEPRVWGANLPRNLRLMELIEDVRAAGRRVQEVRVEDLRLEATPIATSQGGSALIYYGTYSHNGQALDVCFKMLPLTSQEAGARTQVIRRVEREARLLAYAAHPRVVKCYGVLKDGEQNRYGLVLERADARDLDAYLDRLGERLGGRPDLLLYNALRAEGSSYVQLLQLLQDVCATLQHTDMVKVAHRDVKPGNLLLFRGQPQVRQLTGQDDHVDIKLCDFGSARLTGQVIHSGVASLAGTENMVGVGSLHFRAPELSVNETDDGRVDVFAFGVLVWWVLEGRWTQQGQQFMHTRAAPGYEQCKRPPLLHAEALGATDSMLRRLVEACWDQKPDARPSFAVVGAVLRSALRETCAQDRPSGGVSAGGYSRNAQGLQTQFDRLQKQMAELLQQQQTQRQQYEQQQRHISDLQAQVQDLRQAAQVGPLAQAAAGRQEPVPRALNVAEMEEQVVQLLDAIALAQQTPAPTIPATTEPVAVAAQSPVSGVPAAPVQAASLEVAPVMPTDMPQDTTLHDAVRLGRVDWVRALLEEGSNANHQDGGGHIPLHHAASRGNLEIVGLLVDSTANVDQRNGAQQTPLHIAALHGRTDIAEVLLDNGADIHATNAGGHTALHIAAVQGRDHHSEIAALLISRGADVNARNNDNRTPLMECSNPTSAVATLLRRSGAGR